MEEAVAQSMRDSMVNDYLKERLERLKDNSEGAVADYIPELAAADDSPFSVAICTTNGQVYAEGLNDGDVDLEFTIQSMSKPFAYALALEERGVEEVAKYVGVEPSGEAFNELSLEGETKRPMNPMINAGAIAINQMINGEDSTVEERVEKIRQFFSKLAGRELSIDEDVSTSEIETSDRNLSIAHMLRSYGMVNDSAHDAVESYTKQCSIKVTVSDLAMMAATLANGGVQPQTGERVCGRLVARHVQAVMASAGMYNGAGQWMATVGIPAKSGVSGGIMGTLPGRLGLAAFSPKLNEKGNSVRAKKLFQTLSWDMGLHLMEAEAHGRVCVRSITSEEVPAADKGIKTTVRLQGDIDFSAAENFWRIIQDHGIPSKTLFLDLEKVDQVNAIGNEMLKEAKSRLTKAGYNVTIVDPDKVLK